MTIPDWVAAFASRHGLGGIILFDYDCQTGKYDNNIESPEQVRDLCTAIHGLPSRPMVFIDQDSGLVRRLKLERGFSPLPRAKDFNGLPAQEKERLLTTGYPELKALGVSTGRSGGLSRPADRLRRRLAKMGRIELREFAQVPETVRERAGADPL